MPGMGVRVRKISPSARNDAQCASCEKTIKHIPDVKSSYLAKFFVNATSR